MANPLFTLFNQQLKDAKALVASTPQTLQSISPSPEDQSFALQKFKQFEEVKPLVDYSNFSNFVFFNSALDYFNVTATKIINGYPYDGSRDLLQNFLNDIDDYQNYVISVWPSNTGYLVFNPSVSSSVVTVNDLGMDNGLNGQISPNGMLSPTTSSWTVEFWSIPPPVLTGTNAAMFALQKVSGSGDGYSAYFSASSLFFRMVSGSALDELSVPVIPGQGSYFAFVLDKTQTPAQIIAYTGSTSTFPVGVASASSNMGTSSVPVNAGSGPLYFGSGTLSGKSTVMLTGALDDVRVWNIPRMLSDLSSSFNTKIFAQRNLQGIWRFNETGSLTSPFLTYDASGHKLNGIISPYSFQNRASGSIIPFDQPDLVLDMHEPSVLNYIAVQQTSGTSYDSFNDNLITELLPDKFFELEDIAQTSVLENFLYVMARQFDYIKIRIDQFARVLSTDYTGLNQTPDALLNDVAQFFGWEFTGNFLNAQGLQYLLGKNVQANSFANQDLDTKLYEIRNEFWRRVLINLVYMYKTKGTAQSVKTLLRSYGVNENFVRLKEYGLQPSAGITTFRINAEKSVNTLAFGSGSMSGSNYVISNQFSASAATIESRLCFPTTSSIGITPTALTGTIWTMSSSAGQLMNLKYAITSIGIPTGSLIFSASDGTAVTLVNAPIFDEKWYNIVVTRDSLTGSVSINVRSLDPTVGDSIYVYLTASSVCLPNSRTLPYNVWLGATGTLPSQFWMQEFRVWNRVLTSNEMNDHTLNFQSFGSDLPTGFSDLMLHWRLNEGVSGSAAGALVGSINDVSGQNNSGSAFGFIPSTIPYRRFLNDFNYIAPPDQGWNEERIRNYPATRVSPADAFYDDYRVGLEFNMVDALNEDISQILSTLDSFNTAIGLLPNMYRSTYPDIDTLRMNYFKRLQGRLNFRVFSDMLEFFDRSFIDMVQRLLPARAAFIGDEFVIESHMLERPKFQWPYHRQTPTLEFEGVITVLLRGPGVPLAIQGAVPQGSLPTIFGAPTGPFSQSRARGGFQFANVPVGNASVVKGLPGQPKRVNTVVPIIMSTMDKFDLSGVIKFRHSKGFKGNEAPGIFHRVPASVNFSHAGTTDQFGNPILPGITGKYPGT
jgi:Concanavalin A-like lectin/glucanases superfamily